MNVRSYFKRLLTLLLAVVMVVGLLPAGILQVEAAGTVVDAAIMFSDLHTNKSDYKESTVRSIMGAVKSLPVSSVTSCGDAFSVNEDSGKYTGYTSTITNTIQGVLGDVPVNYVWSDHDRYAVQADDKTLLDNDSGLIYGAGADGIYGNADDGNYYIYELSMADLSTNNRYNADFHSNSEVTANIAAFVADAKKLDQTKPLLIASHQPLLDRRNDNGHAYEWATAINTVAEDMDVIFFFGHNHKYDEADDYYYAKGDTMSVCSSSSGSAKNVKLNFTHLCAGYMAPSSTGSTSNTTRKGVVVAVTIYEDAVGLTTYNANGIYTGSYGVDETVKREFAAPKVTLESIAVTTMPTKTEYTVGESFDATGLVVTATYSDNTTKDVTAETSLSGYDMDTAGSQRVTATYEDKTTSFEITVNAAAPTEQTWYDNEELPWAAVTATAESGTVTDISDEDNATVDAMFQDAYWLGFDFSLEGQVEGTNVTVKLWLDPEAMNTDDLAVYYYNETTDAYEPVTGYTPAVDGTGATYITISNAALGTYVYGTPNADDVIPEDAVLDSVTVTKPTKTKYFGSDVVDKEINGETQKVIPLDITGMSVKANYILGEETYSETLVWDEFGSVEGGYALSFDALTDGENVLYGEKTVTVTYGEKSAQFTVWVCKENEAVGDVTIAFDAPCVVSVAVETKEADETITTALADKLEGTLAVYDITPTYANGDTALSGKATVTLPIPEGVENPAVYYVSDDGATVTDMKAKKTEDGKSVTFTTDHFSTYVVGESTEITVPDPETATGSGSTTTTTKKTVYVLSSENPSGNVLIADRNTAGDVHLVANDGGDLANVTTTVIYGDCDGDGDSEYYIELTDTEATNTVWAVTSGYKFANQGEFLRYNNGLSVSSSSSNWTYRNNLLSSSRYLRYNGGWTTTRQSGSATRIYFYVPTEVEVESTTTVSGTYSIAGNPAEVTKVVKQGSTLELGSTLTFKPTSGTATTTDTSTAATYTVVEGGDPNGVISGISGNTVTFTGKAGTALVKVSYETSFGVVTNYIQVQAAEPTYKVTVSYNNKVVSGTTVTVKQVKDGDTLQLTPAATLTTDDGTEDCTGTYAWSIPAEYQHIATVDQNGLVTFKGKDGAFYVTVTFTEEGTGKTVTTGVNISASTGKYSTPTDGTNDFPEYPEKGSVRYDKTAEAVGNFSQTGITKVELSMSGVPFSTPKTLDVVLMLDRSSSMYKSGVQHRIPSTIAATKVFVENIVKNKDGTFNNNRVIVMDFLGGNLNSSAGGGSQHQYESNLYTLNESSGYEIISSQAELDALFDRIDKGFVGQTSLYGTEYAKGLKDCYNALAASRADGNQQFCVFMSDGIPNYMQGETTHFTSTNAITGTFDVTNRTAANGTASRNASKYEYEYYSTKMKNEGVTVYTVGLGLKNTNSAWSQTSKEVCEQVANMLLNDIAGPAGETVAQRDTGNKVSKLNKYFFSVADTNAAEDMANVFGNISNQILDAASNVVATDKIGDDYTMIFDIPTGKNDISDAVPEGQEFYIEVLKYALNKEDHERTGASESLCKLYLGKNGNTYFAAKDAAGTPYETPTFTAAAEGKKAYWTTVASGYTPNANDIVITIDGTTWRFMEEGDGTHNMTAGAYAYGTIDSTTNMSENLVIVTPHFAYSAARKMLAWTADKLVDDYDLALQYFLYLDDSATAVGGTNEKAPGPYETNQWAYITYTNHLGNECRQEFPVPQQTWNGAQVSYVFYLVNQNGQPINKSGQVVDFANATFITQVFTESVIWNDQSTEGTRELNIQYLAADKLSDDYLLYDENASYAVHVFENEKEEELFNYFIISGSAQGTTGANGNTVNSTSTTKVYNTKAGTKYYEYGTYSAKEAGSTFNTTDANGNPVEITTTHHASLDYSDTTVAFAVVWQPKLVEDAVVVDFGLDVLIDVTRNDNLLNTVSGIGLKKNVYGNIDMNTGLSTTSRMDAEPITTADGRFNISIENENQIRFQQNTMQFTDPVLFYYESAAAYTENSQPMNGYMYSSVTVIPATTVYYEDEYVALSTSNIQYTLAAEYQSDTTYYTKDGDTYTRARGITADNFADGTYYTGSYKTTSGWDTNSVAASATQAQDRPGASQISATLDADNVYGYDAAYSNMSQYSMGSAAKTNVCTGKYATAEFDFYGTGFDVISMTSNKTGVIFVKVTNEAGEQVRYNMVDTYYGYTYKDGKWVETTSDDNALYQIPVITVNDLDYGKYHVEISASYNANFDHNTSASGYDFYLDAIRIYDPTGVVSGEKTNQTVSDAYTADGEGWPAYQELRDNLIAASDFANGTLNGIVFVDGVAQTAQVADYVSYGPNNEVYLSAGQAVVFGLELNANVKSVQLGMKSVDGAAVNYVIADASTITAKTDLTEAETTALKTATDMYYDITSLKDKAIVIYNAGGGVLSLTNIKVTFSQKPTETLENVWSADYDKIAAIIKNMNTEEEVFKHATGVSVSAASVTAGTDVTVTVTTDKSVGNVKVNGAAATKGATTEDGVTTWTATVATSSGDVTNGKTITVVTYDADGAEIETITEKVAVKSVANAAAEQIRNTINNIIGNLRKWFGW